ncbi:MAG: hypothetical protein V4574_06545 [Pseudomonadota bacterium]
MGVPDSAIEDQLAGLARCAMAERALAENAAGPVEYRRHIDRARRVERQLLALIRDYPAAAERLFRLRGTG